MMNQQHIQHKTADYALGLLSPSERRRVERHTMACADCRQALRRETEIGQLVGDTLAIAAQPPANLRQFMPTIPQPGFWQRFKFALVWQRPLAPVALVVLLVLGSFGLYSSEQRGPWLNPSPTFLAATATMTDEPTMTLTQTRTEETAEISQTAVPSIPNPRQIVATPAPNPTPIAALPVKAVSN